MHSVKFTVIINSINILYIIIEIIIIFIALNIINFPKVYFLVYYN